MNPSETMVKIFNGLENIDPPIAQGENLPICLICKTVFLVRVGDNDPYGVGKHREECSWQLAQQLGKSWFYEMRPGAKVEK